jgi:branched-subunit amino acid aminotransferase/4-amino-4-deoxychorismate lyase
MGDGSLVTPPLSGTILPGITREPIHPRTGEGRERAKERGVRALQGRAERRIARSGRRS